MHMELPDYHGIPSVKIPRNQDNPLLTPSQELAVTDCLKLLPHFKLIVIKGETSSGKYVVASEIFRRSNASVQLFDLCELASLTSTPLSNQHIISYLNNILSRFDNGTSSPIQPFDKPSKRKRVSGFSYAHNGPTIDMTMLGNGVTKLSLNHPETSNGQEKGSYSNLKIIYFRYYNYIADVLTDCYAKGRYLLPLILKTFIERIPSDVRLLLTTQGCMLPESIYWPITLQTTREDMEHIFTPLLIAKIVSPQEKDLILKLSKTVPVGRILYCIEYASAMNAKAEDPSRNILPEQHSNLFIESYKKALARFSGSTVDTEKDVPKPNPEDDLIGVGDIIEAIKVSVIIPMRLGIPSIPIKKGLLLCGPPGTGKTTIGRWLAHEIKGRFYLIGGEAGVSGSSLIDAFEITVRRARENSPAVIFIDDCDDLFNHGDTYRAFLTILDGIETNKRNDVCVILTCMNLSNIPSSLLRGGRLEMTLITRLPDHGNIEIMLQRSLSKMRQSLMEYDETLAQQVARQINSGLIHTMAGRMNDWNFADIHRCVNDVLRLIVSLKTSPLPKSLEELFQSCIVKIREQYSLCGKCESTNPHNRTVDHYIS